VWHTLGKHKEIQRNTKEYKEIPSGAGQGMACILLSGFSLSTQAAGCIDSPNWTI